MSSRGALRLVFVISVAAQASYGASPAAEPPDTPVVLEWQRQFRRGVDLFEQGQLQPAEKCFTSSLELAPRSSAGNAARGFILSSLSAVLLEQGRIAEAERAAAGGLQACRQCDASQCDAGLANSMRNLALVYRQQNRRAEAEELLTQALRLYTRAGETTLAADALNTLGRLELDRNRPGAAERRFRSGLAEIENTAGAKRTRADLYDSLSATLLATNRRGEAVDAAQRALAAADSDAGVGALQLVRHLCTLASATSASGDYASAEGSLARARELVLRIRGDDAQEFGLVLTAFATLRFLEKRFAEAAEFESKAIEVLGRHLSPDHPQMLKLKAFYATVLRKLKRKREARQVERDLRGKEQQAERDPSSDHAISVSDLRRQSRRR
jgi:tetratricopeptide (TPR) repeat protein